MADNTALFTKLLVYLPLIYVTTKVLKWLFDYFHKISIINKIPGRFMVPFIGNTYVFFNNPSVADGIKSFIEPFKDRSFCRCWLGPEPIILFYKADHLGLFLDTNSKHVKKAKTYDTLKPWLGDSLALRNGEKWVKRRKMLTPAFHSDILKRFYVVMNEKCDILMDCFEKESIANASVDLLHYLKNFALDVISETAMGYNLDTQKGGNQDYVNAIEKITTIGFQRGFKPWFKSDFVFYRCQEGKEYLRYLKTLHGFTNNVIQDRLKDFNETVLYDDDHRIAFLDLLLKAHNDDPAEFTLEDIRYEVDTFMFGGHDTTATSAFWVLYAISQNPDVQKKLHDEIDSVVNYSDEHISYDTLNQLKYLDCVLKESERLYPTIFLFLREIVEDVTLDNMKIPKGTTVQVIVQELHRDERYFPEPDKFLPDRFLPENSIDRHPYTYIPFSAGKRNCIGMRFAQIEVKLLLARVLRDYEIICDTKPNEFKIEIRIVNVPSKKLLFRLQKRTPKT